MSTVYCLLVAILALGLVNAQSFFWDSVNGEDKVILRPSPPKRPGPPNHFEDDVIQPPIAGQNGNGWHQNTDSLNVQVITKDELDQKPPLFGEIEHRPFEVPPPVEPLSPSAVPPPPYPQEPSQVPQQPKPLPEHQFGPQKRPEHSPFEVEINVHRPGHSNEAYDINVHKVDNKAEPTPKYPNRPRA